MDGQVRKEEDARQAVEATQNVSPALYGTGIFDSVGQIGQVDLLQTGLNVLVKVDSSGTINEVNEGAEIVMGMQRDDLLRTDAFSYFTDPDQARGWFAEALQGASVRDKEVEVIHQEGETTSLFYNVVATTGNGQTASCSAATGRIKPGRFWSRGGSDPLPPRPFSLYPPIPSTPVLRRRVAGRTCYDPLSRRFR
jgi:PAS domain-containing protein